MSLADYPTTTILPVTDSQRAKDFYGGPLGLQFLGNDSEGKPQFALAQGATLALIEKPPGAQGTHTALSFEVSDVPAVVAELTAAGVAFADYDLPGLRTINHVAVLGEEKAAWFEDPDGNILCVHQRGA